MVMEFRSYNRELALANAQFKRLFNNIAFSSKDKLIKCTCILGNRARVFKNLENSEKNAMYKLPLIIVERANISKNDDRLANVNNEVKYQMYQGKLDYNLYTPVPVDITYKVTIISKYQEHIDKAISNFIPFFNKDIYVQCEHPKFKGLKYASQVIMDNSIEEEHPDEIDAYSDDLVTCTCTFLFKTYIFGGNRQANGYNSSYISTYLSTYIDEEGNENVTEISVVINDDDKDGFVPKISMIKYGFYPTPLLSAYDPYREWVDSLCSQGIDERPFVDRMYWYINQSDISNDIQY